MNKKCDCCGLDDATMKSPIAGDVLCDECYTHATQKHADLVRKLERGDV